MANEITATATLSFTKSPSATASMGETGKQFTVAGTDHVRGALSIDFAAPSAIPLGGITTPGWFYIKNLDSTNYIQVYTAAAGTAFLKLKPLEFAIGRFTVAAPAWKADTAACMVEYLIVED